ncbi:MAG: indole-3-glycerol phosphate synthase TrpC [Methanosphaera sp.]|nr:indole-3-glycerol phosphate synthase TrpC [Methanosphaera sp.]
MANILDTLADCTRKRVAECKKNISIDEMKSKALSLPKSSFEFEKALNKLNDVAFICEVKKASPSKGEIAKDFPYIEIAKEYQEVGADCISVLTEPEYFKGDIKYLKEINEVVNIPTIRKDFTIDEYMIYEAHTVGAKAVLLICSLLDTSTIKKYISICDSLGLTALVEAHDSEEVKSALNGGARVIGVNNRNLKTFEVDINNSIALRKQVPNDIIFVAESGIKTAVDISKLRDNRVNAVLIGETLMRSKNKKECLNQLKGIS